MTSTQEPNSVEERQELFINIYSPLQSVSVEFFPYGGVRFQLSWWVPPEPSKGIPSLLISGVRNQITGLTHKGLLRLRCPVGR
ncbi:hypothetical protein TNCV_821751 [Trichonephila clavipes]|nr:hypothetical protein TNCV_821751 [Trichonephila clavipes]